MRREESPRPSFGGCTRSTEAGTQALAFHPGHGTFATGGSDGGVSLWDGAHKKRLAQLDPFPTSVAALAFSCDGAKLAVASSYCAEPRGNRPFGLIFGPENCPRPLLHTQTETHTHTQRSLSMKC